MSKPNYEMMMSDHHLFSFKYNKRMPTTINLTIFDSQCSNVRISTNLTKDDCVQLSKHFSDCLDLFDDEEIEKRYQEELEALNKKYKKIT